LLPYVPAVNMKAKTKTTSVNAGTRELRIIMAFCKLLTEKIPQRKQEMLKHTITFSNRSQTASWMLSTGSPERFYLK
jgi:hypothetical protein